MISEKRSHKRFFLTNLILSYKVQSICILQQKHLFLCIWRNHWFKMFKGIPLNRMQFEWHYLFSKFIQNVHTFLRIAFEALSQANSRCMNKFKYLTLRLVQWINRMLSVPTDASKSKTSHSLQSPADRFRLRFYTLQFLHNIFFYTHFINYNI